MCLCWWVQSWSTCRFLFCSASFSTWAWPQWAASSSSSALNWCLNLWSITLMSATWGGWVLWFYCQLLKKNNEGYKSLLWSHWYISPFYGVTDTLYFGLLVTFPRGFKARVGSLIYTWWTFMYYISLRFTSGATHVNLLACQHCIQAILSHTPVRRYIGGARVVFQSFSKCIREIVMQPVLISKITLISHRL